MVGASITFVNDNEKEIFSKLKKNQKDLGNKIEKFEFNDKEEIEKYRYRVEEFFKTKNKVFNFLGECISRASKNGELLKSKESKIKIKKRFKKHTSL
jgi:hypothetical protein